jgi:hypothetical protein
LFTHPSVLRGLLPDQEVSLEELHGICLALTAPPEVLGDKAYRAGARTAGKRSWCGWGVGAMDELITGWDGTGVVELVGPSRVGKSVSTSERVRRGTLGSKQDLRTNNFSYWHYMQLSVS